MRVAFVWFNTASPVGMSHGVLILAGELSAAGHDVRVLHLNEEIGLSSESAREELRKFSPDLVALSFASPHAGQARETAAAARVDLPEATILCGGIHATLAPDEVLGWPGVDAVGIGELDGGPLVDFAGRLAGGADYRGVEGFWVRTSEGERRNRLTPLPQIEDQAPPLLEAVDLERLVEAKRGFGEVIAGRGCPFRCRFCQNHALVERYRTSLGGTPATWPYCRLRSVSNLLAELAEMKRRAPSMKAVMFGDDRLAADRRWLVEFTERYPAEIGLPFIVNATADQIDAETAGLLAAAGCNMVKIGVECAPGRIRREVLGRPHGEKSIREAFANCRAAGINTMAYLMVGIPGESRDDVLGTFRFCAELEPDAVRVSMFCPFPGTEIHQDLAAQGLLAQTSGVQGFLSPSVLPWSQKMRSLLDSVILLAPWLLNCHMQGAVGTESNKLVARVLDVPPTNEAGSGVAEEFRELEEQFARDNLVHYQAPFAERPDWIFLKAPRQRPLINVDSAPGDGRE